MHTQVLYIYHFMLTIILWRWQELPMVHTVCMYNNIVQCESVYCENVNMKPNDTPPALPS